MSVLFSTVGGGATPRLTNLVKSLFWHIKNKFTVFEKDGDVNTHVIQLLNW